jgi:hypothetical protein
MHIKVDHPVLNNSPVINLHLNVYVDHRGRDLVGDCVHAGTVRPPVRNGRQPHPHPHDPHLTPLYPSHSVGSTSVLTSSSASHVSRGVCTILVAFVAEPFLPLLLAALPFLFMLVHRADA